MVEMDDEAETDEGSLHSFHEPTAAVDDASISSSVTDLHALAAFGEIDSLEQALHSRAAATNTSVAAVVNEPDELGLTLLHAAAQSGQPHVVALLLSLGADSSAADASGQTPLHMASGSGFEHIVRALIGSFTVSHSSLDQQDSSGRTALHWAAAHDHDAVVQALIAAGANTQIKDNKGQVASAAQYKHTLRT